MTLNKIWLLLASTFQCWCYVFLHKPATWIHPVLTYQSTVEHWNELTLSSEGKLAFTLHKCASTGESRYVKKTDSRRRATTKQQMETIMLNLHNLGTWTTRKQYLSSQSTFGNAYVEMVGGSFVHFNATVTDHKHGAVRQTHVSGTYRVEFNQFRLRKKRNFTKLNENYCQTSIVQSRQQHLADDASPISR